MPYTLNGNCVVKKDTGETVKCFETRADAIAHLRALYANVPEADWSNEVKALLQPLEREKLPSVWVRAHPYGKATMKDVHGEYFDAQTNFFDDGKLLAVVPVSYYHNHDDQGNPVGEPTAIGVTSGRKYQSDGRWDRVKFFDNVSDDIRARIEHAIEGGTLRASPTVVPDFHSVADDGHISHWLTGSIAVFDAAGRRQPANPRAIAALTPTQLKALYKAAHLEYPEHVMKGKDTDMNKDEWMQKARDAWRAFQKAVGMSDAEPDDDEMKADNPPQAADKDAWEELFGDDDDAAAKNGEDDGNDKDEQDNGDAKSGKPAAPETKREDDMADSKQQQNADEIRLEYDNKMKAMLESNRAMQRELDETKLNGWFDEQLRAGKVMPAERADIVEMALQLKADDAAAHPTMKSANGASATRLAVFQKTIEARPARLSVNGETHGMKFAGFDQQNQPRSANDVSPERVKELLSQTDMGQNILAARKNGSHN